MGFLEQIYSLDYLTERKSFWLLPWTTALQTKPANNSYTDPEIQKSSERAQYSGMVKDEVPEHSSTAAASREGEAAQHTPAQPCSPQSCPGQERGQAAVPTHLPGTATPEQHLRSAARPPRATAAHQERDQSLQGQGAQADTCCRNGTKDTSPPPRVEEASVVTQGKETLRKRFDWNITVNRREN